MKAISVVRIIVTLLLLLLLMYLSSVLYLGTDDSDVWGKWVTVPWQAIANFGVVAVMTWVLTLVVAAVRLRPHRRTLWILWSFVGAVIGAALNVVVYGFVMPYLAPGELNAADQQGIGFYAIALSIAGVIFVVYALGATAIVEWIAMRSSKTRGVSVTSGPVGVS